jgi:TRAP transporter TAXI family solute receptor
MPRVIRDTLISARELAMTAGPFALLAAVLLAGAYYLLKPTPPKRIVLATGSEQGAYAEFGKRYAQELKRYGIEVVLRSSPGSRENLRLLRDAKGETDVAFVQGGSSETPRTQEQEETQLPVMSLGSMFYEPVWIFYREETAKKINREGVISDLSQLRGLRVNVGERGSGTPGVMTRLLRANLMEREDIKRSNLDLTASVVGLLGGTLDAVVLVSAPESPLVQMLLQTPGIRLYEFAQAEAYARRYKFLSPVTLPRGVVDLSRNVPPRDTVLVAATCSLVAREDLHPALVQLLVQAASRIHGGSGWIAHAGQFPSALQSEFALARDAERYYRTGPPLLQRYLPFWLANLIDRMWVALFSIAVILIPLARVVPPLYRYRIRSRIYRWYRHLRQIEDALGRKDADPAKLLEDLANLDLKAERVLVPLAYTDELYTLRSHIALVRERLMAKSG